jgi:hypothetical protein
MPTLVQLARLLIAACFSLHIISASFVPKPNVHKADCIFSGAWQSIQQIALR